MIERSAQPTSSFQFIGHPTAYPLTRYVLKSFGELDSIVPTIASHESKRALLDQSNHRGPGVQRELLALLADHSVTDGEWMVIREGVEQWKGCDLCRRGQGVGVLAARVMTAPTTCSSTEVSDRDSESGAIVKHGEFLLANCSGSDLRLCVSGSEGEVLCPTGTLRADDVASVWAKRGGDASWLVVLLPAQPDQTEYVHEGWGKIRRALVEALLKRGAAPDLRVTLLPAAFI